MRSARGLRERVGDKLTNEHARRRLARRRVARGSKLSLSPGGGTCRRSDGGSEAAAFKSTRGGVAQPIPTPGGADLSVWVLILPRQLNSPSSRLLFGRAAHDYMRSWMAAYGESETADLESMRGSIARPSGVLQAGHRRVPKLGIHTYRATNRRSRLLSPFVARLHCSSRRPMTNRRRQLSRACVCALLSAPARRFAGRRRSVHSSTAKFSESWHEKKTAKTAL